MSDLDHFKELQAQRSAEKLAAAKKELDEALYELSVSQDGRDSEVAADAIENLVKVMMDSRRGEGP